MKIPVLPRFSLLLFASLWGMPAEAQTQSGPGLDVGDSVMTSSDGVLWMKRGGVVAAVELEERSYLIRYPDGSESELLCNRVARPGSADPSFFVGSWEVRMGGLPTALDEGKRLAPLEIREDGSYVWGREGEQVIRGRWESRPASPGIVVLRGLEGLDWTVVETTTRAGHSEVGAQDEIRFFHIHAQNGYMVAHRVGATRSCVLAGGS